VTKPALHLDGVAAGGEEPGRAGVPEDVEADSVDVGLLGGRLQRPPAKVLVAQRLAVGRGEDEVLVAVPLWSLAAGPADRAARRPALIL